MLSDAPSLNIKGRIHLLRDFSSVWYRRPADPHISSTVKNSVAREYALEESWNILNALWEGMDWPLWINHPAKIKKAKHKWSQSVVARRIGFMCPRTLVTNNPDEARSFCRMVERAIIKPVFTSHFQSENGWNMIYTNPISSEDLRIQDIELAPATFQEYIPKKIELRVTVVNNKVFACAIESQANSKTKDDWRHYDLDNTPHHPFNLPSHIKDMCVRIVKHYDLNFGAIDLILTPDNKYYFLELNPNGQWAWIEEMSGLPISSAIIDLLFSRE
ncbi:ATP-dependent carboxylate-amine ligase [Candidatus Parcubacteria bacterium]|nr:ATP-dependent carboxylate-amine ligase [Candidatus Parcubacteria bacterium]